MGKLPAYLHYAKDWLTDVNLCRCSKAAKGVWIDVLDVMFLNVIRGVACNEDGTAWTDQEIARAIGGDLIENTESINELIAKGVARRNGSGAIFSKRMVADEKERSDTKERVRQYRSNERVTANETVIVRPCTGDANETAIKKISESYISQIYKEYPRKIGRGDAFKAIASALQRLLRGEDAPGLFHTLDDAVVYLIQRVKLFAGTPAGQAGEYTPHPATWFNKKRYLDDEAEWSRNGQSKRDSEALPDLSGKADPKCGQCQASGYRASYSSPGKKEPCGCTEPLAAWRNRADGSGDQVGANWVEEAWAEGSEKAPARSMGKAANR